jgi:polysaccharide pyruvyl transferase WcaK-like protein
MPKILVCNERNSTNLGDAVISDCTVWLLKQVRNDVEVITCDLSGRPQAEEDVAASRSNEKSLINSARLIHRTFLTKSEGYRRSVTFLLWLIKNRRRLLGQWEPILKESDLAIVGGGQLLMDNSLNFPLKIREFVHLATQVRVLVLFWDIGVGSRWSRYARKLLRASLSSAMVRRVYLRDKDSYKNLSRLFPNMKSRLCVSHDSALFAGDTYGVQREESSEIVGIGVIATAVLRIAGIQNPFAEYSNSMQVLTEVAIRLYQHGIRFRFFTNGSEDDFAFAKAVVRRAATSLSIAENDLLVMRPKTARELVVGISRFKAVVAYRLHAHIIAYSLGVPSIGLVWDNKVLSFGIETGRCRYFLEPEKSTPDLIIDRLGEAIAEGVDLKRLREMKSCMKEQMYGIVGELIK